MIDLRPDDKKDGRYMDKSFERYVIQIKLWHVEKREKFTAMPYATHVSFPSNWFTIKLSPF